jgi:carbon-monoxide dehydrogenase medium subunit
MIPVSFDYQVASSVDDASRLLEQGGEAAKLIAGGQSLLPLMRLRLTRPTLLVDIGRLAELSYIKKSGDGIVIGALTRHHDLEYSSVLKRACPLLAYVAGLVGDPQVRHRGTIGGAVAHGDPASDVPSALLALEADFVVRGGKKERTIAATEFFTGLLETALRPGELLTEIRVPRLDANKHGWSYQKFRQRAQDWAIVGVAAVVEKENGSINRAAIGLTNMGPTPLRASAVEQALSGGDATAIGEAAERAAGEGDPSSDINGSADYRRHLVQVLVRRAVEEALSR